MRRPLVDNKMSNGVAIIPAGQPFMAETNAAVRHPEIEGNLRVFARRWSLAAADRCRSTRSLRASDSPRGRLGAGHSTRAPNSVALFRRDATA